MSQTNTPQKRVYWKRVGYCTRCGLCCKGKPLYDSIVDGSSGYPKELVDAIKVFECQIDKMNCPDCKVHNGYATCGKYKDRPDFCKLYPNVPSDLINGCGFSFIEETIK